ncbi:MAG: hypothetical protein HY747_03765 [Elusimicrobia bacterium]|nr:hypothetical protein [Elusimicrobiota bacterium]
MTAAIFKTYSSKTLKASVGQPSASSKFCLSCHDGTIAVDRFGSNQGGMAFISGSAKLGTDLSRVHPVSFVYDDALAGAVKHLKLPSVEPSGFGSAIAKDLLRNGKVECVSCHEPHNKTSNAAMLRRGLGEAGLCRICHKAMPPTSGFSHAGKCGDCHSLH